MSVILKHWRGTVRGGFTRTNFGLCGVYDMDRGVEFAGKPPGITCPECLRRKNLRAALARSRNLTPPRGVAP